MSDAAAEDQNEATRVAQRIAELMLTEGRTVHEGEPAAVLEVDDTWTVAANGPGEPATLEPDDCMKVDLDPYYQCAWKNGWLAYLGTPTGGTVMGAPDAGTEDELIVALESAIRDRDGDMAGDPLDPDAVGGGNGA